MVKKIISLGICVIAISAVTALAAGAPDKAKEDSGAKRAKIDELIKARQDAQAITELTDVVASPQYGDLKEWANLELWNRAQRAGQLESVIKSLEFAAGNAPKDIELQRSVAEGYLRLRNFGKVVSIYEKLTQQSPNDQVLQTRLTDYYMMAGQNDKAIARLEPIVQGNPADEYHSDILLNAYVNAGMEDKALALFKQRLAREPKSAGLTARYAQALETFGRKSDAIAEWEKAAQLDPSNGFFTRRENDLKAKK